MFLNSEEPIRLTFLETEEGDGTEAKRSKSFSRVLLVLLFAMEEATGASEKSPKLKMYHCSWSTRLIAVIKHRKLT